MEHLNTNTIHNTRHFACIVLYGTQPNSGITSRNDGMMDFVSTSGCFSPDSDRSDSGVLKQDGMKLVFLFSEFCVSDSWFSDFWCFELGF